MVQGHSNVRQVGDRIETLLAELRESAPAPVAVKVEEVVGLLVELYGAGLERILELVNENPATSGPLLDRFVEDKFVEALLVLHGLHPVDLDTRVEQALARVRPYLGSHAGGVEYLGVDQDGIAHLRLEGSCHGCPSSTVTVKLTIEQAIAEVAPEVIRVEVEGVAPAPTGPSLGPLIQIKRPDGAIAGSPPPGEGDGLEAPSSAWSPLKAEGLLPGEKRVQTVHGMNILVCSTLGNLYAYRDACASCGASLADAALVNEHLRCSRCGTLYNVVLAGRSIGADDGAALHLDPLPLLQSEGGGWTVAVPSAAVS